MSNKNREMLDNVIMSAFTHFMEEREERKGQERSKQEKLIADKHLAMEHAKSGGRKGGSSLPAISATVPEGGGDNARSRSQSTDHSPGQLSASAVHVFVHKEKIEDTRPYKVLKISSQIVVRSDPGKFGPILCQINPGYFVKCFDEKTIDGVLWLCLSTGWICSLDTFGYKCFVRVTSADEAIDCWAAEKENCVRVVNTIAGLLARSHSLVNARRTARSIYKHSEEQIKPLVGLIEVSVEDLLIALASAKALRQKEIFEFIRVAASATSSPVESLKFICEEIHNTMVQRPTMWVRKELSVLETSGRRRHNDQFVMMVARGDMEGVMEMMKRGQEVTAVHSELKYTALHAAADFGQKEMVEYLLSTGISPNIRDARKGQAALHYCAQSGRVELVHVLIAKGADRNLQNHRGLLPYQVADEQGHYECREVLKFPPPEIQFVAVGDFNSTSITLNWVAPILNPKVHSSVIEYIIEWYPTNDEEKKVYFRTKDLFLTVNNLRPSSGHAFTVFSWSMAGRSLPTSKIIHFTLPCEPDSPHSIEVLKVTTNGMLLHWHQIDNIARFDNGGKIDYYQIEICDEATSLQLYGYPKSRGRSRSGNKDLDLAAIGDDASQPEVNDWDNQSQYSESSMGSHEMSFNHSIDSSTTGGGRGSSLPPVESNIQSSTSHRIFKHRNQKERQKQIIGLIPGRSYFSRIRSHNEFGYSKWAAWTGPVQPQAGVQVKEFDLVRREVSLTWFTPTVATHRKVTAFELQVCKIKGAFFRKIHLEENKNSFFAAEKVIESEDTILEYTTLRDDLATNDYRICDLQPGGRYQCRVRSRIDGIWCSWEDVAMFSDIIIVPATRPEVPFNIRPAVVIADADLDVDEDELDFLDGDKKEKREPQKEFDISHNTIVISWMNGNSNGAPILEYNILLAKVRDYRISDLKLAAQASGSAMNVVDKSLMWVDSDTSDLASLSWQDITSAGDFLGPGAFRVNSLTPGASYIFRVRQRNQVDWSDFSASSDIIMTNPTVPPGHPEAYTTSTAYAICRWSEQGDGNNCLSNLEYDVQIATRSLVDSDDMVALPGQSDEDLRQVILERERSRMLSSSWSPAITRPISKIDEFEYGKSHAAAIAGRIAASDLALKPSAGHQTLYVLLDSLAASTFYYIRVRVRTLAGWSTWSYCQEAFRTMSYA